MSLTINKLIAQDIINFGMEHTDSFNYSVSLQNYLSEYNETEQKYILDNLESICDDISKSEVVAEFSLEDDGDDKDLYMTYYWGYLLNDIEKIVCENANRLDVKLEFEEIRDIASDLVDDDAFNDDLVNNIKNYHSRDMEMS